MGSGSSKTSSNKTPPSPNSNNFPVQSNPKFQTSGNFQNQYPNQYPNQFPNQYQNQWPDQNQNDFYNFQPYNDQQQFNERNVPNNFPPNEPYLDQNNGYQRSEPHINQRSFPDINQYNRDMAQFSPPPQPGFEYDEYSPQIPPRVKVNMPVRRHDYHRPNIMPLTHLEIEEYRRKGLHFPPHRGSDNPVIVPCSGVNRNFSQLGEPEPEEYTVTAEEVNLVRSVFDQNCGHDRRMDFQQFTNLYHHDYGTSKRAFGLMDRDNDGLISFDDFLLGYCKTRSPSAGPLAISHHGPMLAPQNRADQHLPFGPLDEYDPYTVPLENIAASLKPYVY